MSPSHVKTPLKNQRFPRVSGDEPGLVAVLIAGVGFSPRERG